MGVYVMMDQHDERSVLWTMKRAQQRRIREAQDMIAELDAMIARLGEER